MKTGQITETVQTVSTLVEDMRVEEIGVEDIGSEEISETDSQVQAAVEAAVAAAVDGLAEALADEEADENLCQSFDASPVDDEADIANAAAVEGGPQATSDAAAVSADSAAETTSHSAMVGADDKVSKKDLVSLLEGFVRIIKTDEEPTLSPVTAATQAPGTGIELSRGNMVVAETRVDDRTVEIDQLRGLVIEAQDTIIKLLTDRVDDRSRIATLEAQLALLPDLQAQADRAMSVAVRTEEYRTELSKMRFELDRFRLFRVRIEGEQRKGTVFNRIQKWLFSRPNRGDDTMQRGDQ